MKRGKKQSTDRPTLIEVKQPSVSDRQTVQERLVYGAPLGADEAKLTKEAYSWTFEEDFHVPSEVYDHFKEAVKDAGQKKEATLE
ncbi:hypothetical protein ACEQPO_14850 [Bacillus sp. SL00103]